MAKIAVLVGQEYEDSELTVPVEKLTRAGHEVELLGVKAGEEIAGKKGKARVKVDAAVTSRRPDQFDALLIPGGHSPDHLRMEDDVVTFVKGFGATGRPIAAICHGPQLLIEASLVRGRTMTSWPSVRTDLRNAGAEVVDKEVVEDGPIITSRKPEDVEAFSRALIGQIDRRTGRAATAPAAASGARN